MKLSWKTRLLNAYDALFPAPILRAEEKHQVMLGYAKEHNLRYFVETGTFRGETVEAMRDSEKFAGIASCELDRKLAQRAYNLFDGEGISIRNMDSVEFLRYLESSRQFQENTLFWLDAHYSGEGTARGDKDTPILEELEIIFRSNGKHVILIDDARCFKGKNGYPTRKQIQKLAEAAGYSYEDKDDIMRLVK